MTASLPARLKETVALGERERLGESGHKWP